MQNTSTNIKSFAEWRSGFALRGTSINKWATQSGFRPHTAYDALKGARGGPKAQAVLKAADKYLAQ
jgi:hypothetical protein